jgi:hypothetical protein
VSHQHCERCKYPRFDEEEEEVILPPPPQAQSNNKGSKRPTKASSKSNKAPSSTVKAAVAKVAKPKPIKAVVAKVAKPKPAARVDVSKFIDDEARDAEGENEYDTDAAEQLRKEAESSLEEQSDENGTSLVAHLPLPEDHQPVDAFYHLAQGRTSAQSLGGLCQVYGQAEGRKEEAEVAGDTCCGLGLPRARAHASARSHERCACRGLVVTASVRE